MSRRRMRTKRRARAPKVPCAYCGRREATEEDHVPPQGLFAERDEPLLIKVRACHQCNNAASADEEYLIWAVTVNIKATGPAAEAVRAERYTVPTTMRRRRMATRLLATLRPVDMYSPGGIYLGSGESYDPNLVRVNRALCKVVRGLYFHETGTRVPDGYTVEALAEPNVPLLRFSTIRALLREPLRTLVPDGFEYRFGRAVDDPVSAVLLMTFFQGLTVVGFVTETERERRLGY